MSNTLVGLLLGSAASVCWGIADFIARGATRKIGATHTLFAVLTISLLGVGGYTLPHGITPMTPPTLGLVILTGLLALGGYLALYRAFKIGMLSVVSSIASCNAVIPVILALIFLGERPLPWQYGGIVFVLTGVVLLSIRGGAALPHGTHQLGVLPALVTMILFGLTLFAMKLCVDAVDPQTVALVVRLVGVGVLVAIMLVRGRMTMPPPEVRLPLLAAGLLDAAAFILFCEALTHTLLSLVAPISSTIPVVTVALAWVFLHERLTRNQWLGLALALGGVTLVAIT